MRGGCWRWQGRLKQPHGRARVSKGSGRHIPSVDIQSLDCGAMLFSVWGRFVSFRVHRSTAYGRNVYKVNLIAWEFDFFKSRNIFTKVARSSRINILSRYSYTPSNIGSFLPKPTVLAAWRDPLITIRRPDASFSAEFYIILVDRCVILCKLHLLNLHSAIEFGSSIFQNYLPTVAKNAAEDV